jgi:multidrug efflux pump subunit AcrA (membrane-fusion protein)
MAFNPFGLFGQNTVAPATPLTDAEKLAQVMGGNLSGTLTGADKLMGLSALLKSVSRGSQTTPQQAIAQLQQQKSAELQNRIAIDQARKQAERQAQLNTVKTQYVSELEKTNPQLARAVQLMSADNFEKLIIEQNKVPDPTRLSFDALGRPRNPFSGAIVNPSAVLQNLPTVASDEQFNALPSGAQFVDPDGNIRRKP